MPKEHSQTKKNPNLYKNTHIRLRNSKIDCRARDETICDETEPNKPKAKRKKNGHANKVVKKIIKKKQHGNIDSW